MDKHCENDDVLLLTDIVTQGEDDMLTIPECVEVDLEQSDFEDAAFEVADFVASPDDHKNEDGSEDGPEDKNDDKAEIKDGQIWAYLGVMGGAGVTSLAVQTAFELSALHKDKTVCLVDLDFERGDCAGYLDIMPSVNLDELNAAKGRMDADLAATFIGQYKKKFSVISSEGEMGGNDRVDTDALLGLLDCVCGMFDFVVLDIPPMWRPWTQAVIGAADKFALVTEMRVPALHRTKKLSAFISSAMSLPVEISILVNKYERRNLSHSVNIKDAGQVLGKADFGQICVDEETVRSAINCGKPAGKISPEARYTKSVRAHVHHWLGTEAKCEKAPISLFKRRPKYERRRERERKRA
ncbi:MAG: hypothetical protein COA69_11580 [Robiginitomaculum sp.]|nr:MAG: hypothetical protein COA69_11580 [Robiginitomaculum sp.]